MWYADDIVQVMELIRDDLPSLATANHWIFFMVLDSSGEYLNLFEIILVK